MDSVDGLLMVLAKERVRATVYGKQIVQGEREYRRFVVKQCQVAREENKSFIESAPDRESGKERASNRQNEKSELAHKFMPSLFPSLSLYSI